MSRASVFAALGDETRLRLLTHLARRGPASIVALTGEVPLTRQAVRKHLEVLSGAGLVRGEKRGREHMWALEPTGFDAAHNHLDDVARGWDEALDRLRRFVEGD